MKQLVLILISGGLALAIAHFLGRKRQIGFGWSFFFCLFLSPFGGFITTMLSRKYYDSNPRPSKTKNILGWVLIVLCSINFIGQMIRLGIGNNGTNAINGLFVSIGFIGLGFYLIELGKGKNFNTEAITKTDS